MFSNVLQKYNKIAKYQNERVVFSLLAKNKNLWRFISPFQLFLLPLPRFNN